MPDVPISLLDSRSQRLLDKSQAAWAAGHLDYVEEACSEILRAVPGCLAVRRLQREARLARPPRAGCWGRAALVVARLRLRFRPRALPERQMTAADEILRLEPNDATGLTLLAHAAAALDLPETALFAWECLRCAGSREGAALRGLAEAYLALNREDEAMAVAEEWQRLRPQDGEALALLRRVSVAHSLRGGHWTQEERAP